MADANIYSETAGGLVPVAAGTARSSGAIIRLHDGRAGVVAGLNSVAATEPYACYTEGIFEVTVSSLTVSDIQAAPEAWWDTDNNKAVATQPTNGFKLGVWHATVASTDTKALVNINVQPRTVTLTHTVAESPGTSLAIKTGLLSIVGRPVVQIWRSNRVIIVSYDATISGGTITIANVASNYTLTEGDEITIIAMGLGTAAA